MCITFTGSLLHLFEIDLFCSHSTWLHDVVCVWKGAGGLLLEWGTWHGALFFPFGCFTILLNIYIFFSHLTRGGATLLKRIQRCFVFGTRIEIHLYFWNSSIFLLALFDVGWCNKNEWWPTQCKLIISTVDCHDIVNNKYWCYRYILITKSFKYELAHHNAAVD